MSEDAEPPGFDIVILREDEGWSFAPGDAEAVVRGAALAALAAAPSATRPSGPATLSVVLADDALLQRLNRDFRGRDRPTNVLSFANRAASPATPPGAPSELGDVVLARETLLREAAEQGKRPADHLAHLVVHGVLHLLGYDHEAEPDALVMEGLEVEVLAGLGIADPYAETASGQARPRPATSGAGERVA